MILWVGGFAHHQLITLMALRQADFAVHQLTRPEHGFSTSLFGIRWLNRLWTRIERRFIAERVVILNNDAGPALQLLRQRLGANGIVWITSHAALLPVFTIFGANDGSYDVTIERRDSTSIPTSLMPALRVPTLRCWSLLCHCASRAMGRLGNPHSADLGPPGCTLDTPLRGTMEVVCPWFSRVASVHAKCTTKTRNAEQREGIEVSIDKPRRRQPPAPRRSCSVRLHRLHSARCQEVGSSPSTKRTPCEGDAMASLFRNYARYSLPYVRALGSSEKLCFEARPIFGSCPIQSHLRTLSSCSVAGSI